MNVLRTVEFYYYYLPVLPLAHLVYFAVMPLVYNIS